MDVANAFLYAVCHDIVFIEIPLYLSYWEIKTEGINKIRLNKMLYEGVDSQNDGRRVRTTLVAYGFDKVYNRSRHTTTTIRATFVTHVDDGTFTRTQTRNGPVWRNLCSRILRSSQIQLTHFFCGIKVEQRKEAYYAHQTHYVEELAREYINPNLEMIAIKSNSAHIKHQWVEIGYH